jgi:hypothetical protein
MILAWMQQKLGAAVLATAGTRLFNIINCGGVAMGNKLFTRILLFSAVAMLFPLNISAAGQPTGNERIEKLIVSMQLDLQVADQSGDLSFITSETGKLLDAMSAALKNDDQHILKAAVDEYAAKMNGLQDQELELACVLPLALGMLGPVQSMTNTLAGGGSTACMIVNLSNSIADIISTIQTYKICVIDNSENPDNATRQTIVQNKVAVKTYNFITSLLNVALCTADPEPSNYITLFFDFIGIFPAKEE